MSHWKSFVNEITQIYLHTIDLCETYPGKGKRYFWLFTNLNVHYIPRMMLRCSTRQFKWRPKEMNLPNVSKSPKHLRKKYSEVKICSFVG